MKRITLTLPAPYVGLRPFDEKDALLFFGRDNHVRDLLAKLGNQQHFISVLGASGTGKSSLVRAGLIPALHRGALASVGYHWNVHIFKPGDAPLHNLVHALTEDPRWIDNNDRATSESSLRSLLTVSPLALTEQYRQRAERFGNEALLLVVDQFEEIFRYRQKNIDEAEAFIQLLLRTASEGVPIYIVMTMRTDFLGNCVAFFGLPEAINSGLYLTPRLGPDQVKSIIAAPLTLVNGDINPVLTNRLVNTLGGEDELPVLEHALLRMWNHAKAAGRNCIEAQDFETICASQHPEQAELIPKVAFAIDNHASAIYESLTVQQRNIARQTFLALVERHVDYDVRRPQIFQQLAELIGKDWQEDLRKVLDAFRAEYVGFLLPAFSEIIHDETLIDISHESLFRQWYQFQQWLKEEELDVFELKEWQQRAMRQQQGGGWLDENDCSRAQRWRERMDTRTEPQRWATRYADEGGYFRIDTYIEASVQHLNQAKIERERLEREKQEAVTKQLEAEACLQRESAEQAEKDKQQAQAFATVSRRRSVIAIAAAFIAIIFAVLSIRLWLHADNEKTRAEKMARDAQAGELIATAEKLAKSNPDQSVLLGLAAWHINVSPKADAFLRFTQSHFNYRSVLRGHDDGVMSAQFSPDGKTVMSASLDKTIRLWDTADGNELHILRGHDEGIISAQFSPDGKTIVSTSLDKTIRLWDTTSSNELHILRGHDEGISSAQFSPDGRTIVSASWDGTIRLWDTTSGKQLYILHGHDAGVSSAQFSPDGKTIVSTSFDKTIRLWDTASGDEVHILRGHDGEVYSAQFSPDGKTIVSTSWDKTMRMWNTASGSELHILRGHSEGVISAQFSPDGRTIVSASWDRTVRLWNAISGKELHILRGHDEGITSVQFSPDGKTIVSASLDKTIRLWDAAGDNELHILRGHSEGVISAQFSPDGKNIMTTSEDKAIRMWDTANGNELHILRGHDEGITSAQFSPDGKTIVSTSWDKTIRLWDTTSSNELHILRGHDEGISSAQFSPDGRTIVSASWDGTIRLWDTTSGKELHILRGHSEGVISAQFSPDGKTIVSASWDKTIRLWNIISGNELHSLRGHKDIVNNVQFSPDGRILMTISKDKFFSIDKTIYLWDVASGKELHILPGYEDKVISAKFSPDGRTIVSASWDKTARLWNVARGKELYILRGHKNKVVSAQFSPNGKHIVTTSEDKTARLWDSTSDKELHVLRGHEDTVMSAQFSPDGKIIMTVSNDKTVRLWRCNICRPVDEIVAGLSKRIGRKLTEEERHRFGVPNSISLAN